MKKHFYLIVAMMVLLIAVPLAGCTAEVQAYSDPSKAIDIGNEKEFVVLIALESNPTTGYGWQASFDLSVFELIEQSFEIGEYAKENIVGAGGTEMFRFKALKEGTHQITFEYKRSWESESIDQKTFTIEVK